MPLSLMPEPLDLTWLYFSFNIVTKESLRDPAFQPSSANAGSLIPRLRTWSDADWALGALILAVLLATNLTIVLRDRQATRTTEAPLISFVAWLAIWSVFFGTFWLTFTVYLLNQWLID